MNDRWLTSQPNVVYVQRLLSPNPTFRESANLLFSYIQNIDADTIIVSFNGVNAVTRSFIHQYLINKTHCEKKIVEVGMSKSIKAMYNLVSKRVVAVNR